MKQNYDAIILGTGIAGYGVAIALAEAGRRVLLIGKKGIRGEASPAAAGILDPFFDENPKSPFSELSFQAFSKFPSFIRHLSKRTRQDVGYRQTGMLYVAFSQKEEERLKARYRRHRKSFKSVRWVKREGVFKMVPSLNQKVRCGLFYPTIGRIQPRKMMRALNTYARSKKVTVQKFSKGSSLVQDHGKVAGLRIGHRFFPSSVVVNATGSWSGTNSRLGIKPPVRPVRGQIAVMRGNGLKIPVILHTYRDSYVVPWNPKEYLVGSTVERVGFQPGVTRRGIAQLQRKAESIIPEMRTLKLKTSWAGLRPLSRDQFPLIGATKIRGLFVSTGFFRSGILIGCFAGKQLASGILTGKMPRILKAFDPIRFHRTS